MINEHKVIKIAKQLNKAINEDLTLDEFNEMMGGCKYATVCPFFQYRVTK